MIPVRVESPQLRPPIVTILLIATCGLAWVFLQGMGSEPALAKSVCNLGAIPGELTGRAVGRSVELGQGLQCVVDAEPAWHTLVSSMFLHGSWLHLIGNMWFLWLFGSRVEDSSGRARFLALYLLSGIAAGGAQILSGPGSPIPMVGASGAIAGVMGAFLVLYPRVPVRLFVFLGFFITTVRVPAFLMLGYWFLLQVLSGLPQLAGGAATGGVAFWAHAGGFIAGALMILVLRDRELVEDHREPLRPAPYQLWR